MLFLSAFVAIIGVITLYAFPDFKLGSLGIIILAVLAWFLGCFQAYHDLRLKLDKYEAVPAQLKRLIAEGDRIITLDNQCLGGDINKIIQGWSASIRKLIEKEYPDRKEELDRVLDILNTNKAMKEPLVHPVQQWLKTLRDELLL